jgi:predicted acetyltransferase
VFRLVDPDLRYRRSFLAAADEFAAEGLPAYGGIPYLKPSARFPGALFTRAGLEDAAEFERMVAYLVADRLQDTPRPPGWVACTVQWIVEDEEYVGRISVRHELTADLLTWGGHIGYGVRPTRRGRGAATYALTSVLPRCAALGIDPALVTCDVDNEPSRRTIERAGGVYEDTRKGKLRYWVPTGRSSGDTTREAKPSAADGSAQKRDAAANPSAPSATATTSHGSMSTGAEPTICEPGDSAATARNSVSKASRSPGVANT